MSRFSHPYYSGAAVVISLAATGNVVITGSAALEALAVLRVDGHVIISGSAVIQLFGGEIFTADSGDEDPFDLKSGDETPMALESADGSPLLVTS